MYKLENIQTNSTFRPTFISRSGPQAMMAIFTLSPTCCIEPFVGIAMFRLFLLARMERPCLLLSFRVGSGIKEGISDELANRCSADVLANPKTAQAITKINGINATKYVEDAANAASRFHDADASYNSMFWSKPTAAKGNVGDFVGAYSFLFYPGDTTNLTYANGTTIEVETKALIDGNMTGVVDGPSMYKRFCSPLPLQPAAASANTNTTINTITNATIPGYPTPVILSPDRTISGYYLSGPGLDNVAVIYLQLFPVSNFAEFQTAISDFLRKAKAAGKTRLVIDLQGNRGGAVLLAYDFFRQLFPSIVQDGISRWKLSKTFEHLPRIVSELIKDIDPATETNLELRSLYYTPWSYRHNLNISNHNFERREGDDCIREFGMQLKRPENEIPTQEE